MNTCHVLAVDDEAINLSLIKAFFLGQPYELTLCSSGAKAVSIINDAQHRIDIVLLDLMMPELDGFAVLRAIRGNSLRKNIPVIVQSGNGDGDYIRNALAAGANEYLVKPFVLEDLTKLIRKLMD